MRALYTAATGMHAAQTQIENIANNLANASTTGFKKSRETFADLVYQTVGSGNEPMQVGSGSRITGLARDFRNGDTIQTSGPLDLLIDGPGFFKVKNAAGEVHYTRDGHFRLDAEGNVVTASGSMLDPNITVGPGESLTILADGTVMRETVTANGTESVNAGTITVSTFQNPAGLEALGGNMFRETTASGEAQDGTPGAEGAGSLLQYALEGSNVDAAEELVAMITAQRSYELSSKVIETSDQMMQTAVGLRR